MDRFEAKELAAAVDVTLDNMAAERGAGCGGEFEIHDGAGLETAERGAVQGFFGEIGVEKRRLGVEGDGREGGETGSAHGHAVADAKAVGEGRSGDGNARGAGARLEANDGPGGFDDPGEHVFRLRPGSLTPKDRGDRHRCGRRCR